MLNDVKITLITKEEFFKNDQKGFFKHDYQLDAIKKYGSLISDTTLVKITDGNGYYSWTRTKGAGNKVGIIDSTGNYSEVVSNYLPAGIRPVLKLPGRVDKIFPGVEPYYEGKCEFVELGEYPQNISADIDFLLETSYKENKYKLKKTGRVFHINNQICEEYQYIDSKNYIRYRVDLRIYKSVYINRGFEKENGEYIWLNVRPVKWLVDKTDTLISEYNLLSGIIFSMDGYDGNFEKTYMYDFLNNVMFKDIFQDYLPKKEEVKAESKEEAKKEPKDNILQMIKGLLYKTKEIKDEDDKINIVNDLMSLARLYADELIKIKNKEKGKYKTERDLISEGILPYYVYIEREIEREINIDNKESKSLEIKEIENNINNLTNKASLISNEVKRLEILQEIENLRLNYLNNLVSKKKSYEKIDFTKPLEEVKTNSGEVKLTFIPPKPVLIKELVEKELEISKKINQELNNNYIIDELVDLEKNASEIVKRKIFK